MLERVSLVWLDPVFWSAFLAVFVPTSPGDAHIQISHNLQSFITTTPLTDSDLDEVELPEVPAFGVAP
jgi:hypothetical protein